MSGSFAPPGSGGGGGAVSSVFSRTGAVTAANNDYSATQINGFDAQVRTNRLDQLAVPTADVNLNSRKITNLATPTATTDATTKAYVDGAIAGGGSFNPASVAITGGTIDNTALGATTASTGRFTNLSSTGTIIWTPATAQTLTASSTINATATVQQISSASDITLTSNPQIATGTAGQELIIYNSGSFTITLQDTNGLALNGTLALGSTKFARFRFLGGFWQLAETNGSPVWTGFSLQNSFYSITVDVSTYQAPEYTKFNGAVYCRGLFHRATTSVIGGTVVATLPTGFRPSAIRRFDCGLGNTNVIDVDTNGEIRYPSSFTINYDTLENIRFHV